MVHWTTLDFEKQEKSEENKMEREEKSIPRKLGQAGFWGKSGKGVLALLKNRSVCGFYGLWKVRLLVIKIL